MHQRKAKLSPQASEKQVQLTNIIGQIELLDEKFKKYNQLLLLAAFGSMLFVSIFANSEPIMGRLAAGVPLALILGVLGISAIATIYGREVSPLLLEYITGDPHATIKTNGSPKDARYRKHGLRGTTSKEVRFKGEISTKANGLNFTIAQFFDGSGNKKAGSGLMITIDKKNNINSNILILSEKTMNKRFASMGKGAKARKGFADIEFESLYEVFCQDGVDAHFILNPATLEKLKDLRHEYEGDIIEMAITPKEDVIYINTAKRILPKFMQPLFRRDYAQISREIKECRDSFKAIHRTIETLN